MQSCLACGGCSCGTHAPMRRRVHASAWRRPPAAGQHLRATWCQVSVASGMHLPNPALALVLGALPCLEHLTLSLAYIPTLAQVVEALGARQRHLHSFALEVRGSEGLRLLTLHAHQLGALCALRCARCAAPGASACATCRRWPAPCPPWSAWGSAGSA